MRLGRATGWLGGLLLLGVSLAGDAAAQKPGAESNLGPALTPKQQREWLAWNHRRVQRHVHRLAELSDAVGEQARAVPSDRLPPEQRQDIEQLRGKIAALSRAFEKTDPQTLPLGIVGRAEAVETAAKTLRESFGPASKLSREVSRLQELARQIQEHSKRVASRLRQP